MQIKNLNIGPKMILLAFAGASALCILKDWAGHRPAKNTYNYAIEVNGNIATIIPIKTWIDYEGEQLQIVTEDDTVLIVSSLNTRFMNTLNGDITPYDYAKALVGETGEIKVLSSELVNEEDLSLQLKP